eukprot:6191806-Pleurochrysis_carterae.AAC.2
MLGARMLLVHARSSSERAPAVRAAYIYAVMYILTTPLRGQEVLLPRALTTQQQNRRAAVDMFVGGRNNQLIKMYFVRSKTSSCRLQRYRLACGAQYVRAMYYIG